jgi:cytochrome c553
VPPTKAPTKVPPTKAPTKVPPTKAPPAAKGVTAAQVQKLLLEKFNTADRDLTLWNIQPGLGTVMMEYGRRFVMVKLAADAGDWGMAQYQLKEQTEIQEVGEVTRPGKAELLKNFEHTYLDPLATAIEKKDKAGFDKAYDAAIEGCNACHAGTGHPYIKFAPASSPQDFLKLAASEPVTEKEGEEKAGAKPTAAPDKPLTWQELADMVDSFFNNADRSLALWNIQPGLGTVMMEYGKRFALAKHAADAGDWGMAQYQLKEQTEIQEVGEVTRPGKAELLKNFEHTYLDPLAKAIEDQDKAAFDKAYSAAIEGCNGCHGMTGHPYVRYQMPPTSPEPFLKLEASKSKAAEEEKHAEAKKPSYPSGNPTLEDAKKMIDDRFNKSDRSLALWAIQPGLGTVMIEYGYRFGNVWTAAEAGNWDLAAYQLKEQTEIQEVGEATRPGKAELLKNFEHTYLDPLAKAIKDQDKAAFEKEYKAAVEGCNACHAGTGHPYVRYEIPQKAPADFLEMGAQ